jgi:hypothetical protein
MFRRPLLDLLKLRIFMLKTNLLILPSFYHSLRIIADNFIDNFRVNCYTLLIEVKFDLASIHPIGRKVDFGPFAWIMAIEGMKELFAL